MMGDDGRWWRGGGEAVARPDEARRDRESSVEVVARWSRHESQVVVRLSCLESALLIHEVSTVEMS